MEFIARVPNRTGSSLWPSHGAFYASSELTARFLFRRALFRNRRYCNAGSQPHNPITTVIDTMPRIGVGPISPALQAGAVTGSADEAGKSQNLLLPY